MEPPFPIIQVLDGETVADLIPQFPFFKSLHYLINGLPTTEEPRVDTHILCWDHSGVMPEYFEDQVYWYVVLKPDEVSCKKCLEWLHA